MRIAFALLMALHGVAHLVGFAVSWRLLVSDEVPFKTTLLDGRVDLGEAGVKVVGVLWLLLAALFVAASAGAFLRQPWWATFAAAVALGSLALSAASLPEARVGLFVNLALLAALAAGPRVGWW